jgi:hypothetical protein
VTSTLRRWLALRTRDDLVDILIRRPDVVHRPVPRDLGEVADRLHYSQGLLSALADLPQPCFEVLETLLVFGPASMSRDELAATLHVAADDDALDTALAICAQWAIAWEFNGLLHTPGALRTLLPAPLRLGPPVADLLSPRTVEDLRSRASLLGLPDRQRKADILEMLAAFYADGDTIRALHEAAPARQRDLLSEAAWKDPVLHHDVMSAYPSRVDPAIAYLMTHGLVIGDWQRIVVPREVGVAVRGAQWHPAITAQVQIGATVDAGISAVDGDAAAAGNTAIEHLAALLDACGATPVALLKTGGIGVREIKRLAKAAGVGEAATRLWLELAYEADLLDIDSDEVVPTEAYDEWLALEPADRLVALCHAWMALPVVPLMDERPPGVPARSVLVSAIYDSNAAQLRPDVLNAAAQLPDGTGLADVADLVALVRWRRPLTTSMLDDPVLAVAPIWDEARQLGLVGRGAISSLGRALLAGDGTITPIARGFAHSPTTEAIFQADLTIVVPGSPTAATAALLDSVADQESRGAAGTWRCSPNSVRRALDAGGSADDLLTALRRIAVGGALPQPLEYLVADVARRHGALRVRKVECVLKADDHALLAEIVATKSLASLGLSALAPNVLASAAPVERTLLALRAAGYAPVGEDADGVAIVERVTSRRAPRQASPRGGHVPTQSTGRRPRRDPTNPQQLAAALLSGTTELESAAARTAGPAPTRPSRAGSAPFRIPTFRAMQHYASHLSNDEQRLLAHAIDNEAPVWIEYTSAEGAWTERVIEPVELDGGTLVAWCRLRDDERNFTLSRIGAVEPI